MTNEEKEKIGLIIIDTLYEYLTEKEIQGDVILENQFDDITDDLINKLFIHNVSKCLKCGSTQLYRSTTGKLCCTDCVLG